MLRVLKIQTRHPKHNDNISAGSGVAGQVVRVGFPLPQILSFLSSTGFSSFFPSFFSFGFFSILVSSPQKLHNPYIKTVESNINQRTWN
jgi:hypothetical protein